uniref:Wax synthase domain-containing protein n=1 Tax=Alexandrium monilatum TaxID=311494 RepID=A0A7S4UL61_9DINO
MADFWGKRWNLAFADMNRYVFVAAVRTALTEDLKVSKAVAGQAGVFTAFVASALLHGFGITVPVLAGFGGPSLYFLIQGLCVVMEKQPAVTAWHMGHPIMARLLMWIAIAAPFPICFVVPFRTEIALPLTLFVAGLPERVLSVFQ